MKVEAEVEAEKPRVKELNEGGGGYCTGSRKTSTYV